MKWRWVICLLAALLAAGCGKKDDQQALTGSWKVVSAEEGGKPPEETIKKTKVLIIDTDFSLHDANGRRTMKYKIDATKSPKHIDLDWDNHVQPGIYELSGDDLKVCFDQAGKTRPTAFKTEAGDKVLLLVLKREK
jgi:uncharacterized protein (TIGR03067 family)